MSMVVYGDDVISGGDIAVKQKDGCCVSDGDAHKEDGHF